MRKLQHLKAKIIRLHTVKCKSMIIDIHDTTEYQGEKISLYQLIQRRQRRRGRLITELLDEAGNLQTSSRAILRVLREHMRRRYMSLQVEREYIEQLRTIGMTRGAEKWDTPITDDEVWRMLKGVKKNKARCPEGLSTGFFKTNWNWLKFDIVEILNEMLITGIIHEHQKRGLMYSKTNQAHNT